MRCKQWVFKKIAMVTVEETDDKVGKFIEIMDGQDQ